MKTIKKIASIVLIIVLTLIAILILPFVANNKNNIVKAEGEVLITVTHSAVVGGAFTVDINIDPNGKNINGMQFDFAFDPAVVQADSITFPYPVDDPVYEFTIPGTINNTAGTISGNIAVPDASLWDESLGDYTFGLTPFTIATIQISGFVTGTSTLTLPYITYNIPPLIVSQSGDSAALPYIVYNSVVSDDITLPTLSADNIIGNTIQGAGDTIALTFSEPVKASDNIWSANEFTSIASPDGTTLTLANAAFGYAGNTLTITLNEAADNAYLKNGNIIAVTPATGKITDIAENPLANTKVTGATAITGDVSAPTVALTYSPDRTVKNGDTVTITATFNEAVSEVVVPTITIATAGDGDLTATNMAKTSSIVWTYSWAVPAGSDEDGAATITITATDLAGNANATATNNTRTIDNTAPTTTISGIGISADTGTSATDFLTNTAAQTITGTLSATLAAGEILYGSVDAGATYTNVTSKVIDTAIIWHGATLSGNSSIKFKVTDAAANDGSVATQAYILDTTAPTNQNTVFASSVSKQGGASVTIVSSGDATNNVWFAPAGATSFSAGATMTTAGGTAIAILTPATAGDYKLFVIDAAGNYSIASTATLIVASSAKNITSFNFTSPAVTGTVDNTAHTVAFTVPYGTSVTALAPTIAVSANATISPLSGVAQNFTNPATYTVTAEDATTQAYTITVTIAAAPPSGGGGGGGGSYTPTSSVTNTSISINSGSAAANNTAVTLTIGATNATKMAISNNADFSGGVWETFAASKAWTLISGDGAKTVYIKFQDSAGVATIAISDTITLDTSIVIPFYSDGALLKSSSEEKVYVIKNSQKEWIKTAEEFIAGGYKWENIKTISKEELDAIPVYGSGGGVPAPTPTPAPAIGNFPDGALIKISDSFRVYVIISQKKKWIATPEVFETLGYKWGNITVITKAELDKIPDYEDNLIRTIGDYKVYLVVSGIKRHIPNPEIFLDYGFVWGDVKDVPQSTIDKYSRGYLIRESRQEKIYYLSSTGIKKWIPTPEIFSSYNNKWEDIQVISKKEMESYPQGNIMRYSGKLYLIEGLYKRLIPSDAIFTKNKYKTELILDANKTEFDWYKTGAAVK